MSCTQALAAHEIGWLCMCFEQSNGHLGIYGQTLAYPRPPPPPVVGHLQLHTASDQTGGGEGPEMRLPNQLVTVLGQELVHFSLHRSWSVLLSCGTQCQRVQVILLIL